MRKLQEAPGVHCGKEKHPPIYEPSKFFEFCSLAGAANVYNFILSCMNSSRHSEERTLLNQKCTVVILYQLCFGYSQKCNFFKKIMVYFVSFVIYPKVESRRSGNWAPVFQVRSFQETVQPLPSKISKCAMMPFKKLSTRSSQFC